MNTSLAFLPINNTDRYGIPALDKVVPKPFFCSFIIHNFSSALPAMSNMTSKSINMNT